MRKRRSHSAGERAEVGSSMIRMRASSERALAISTSCCSPMRRPAMRASGSSSMPRRARSFRAAAVIAWRSRKRPARSGSRPRKMLAATLSSGTRLSSWWMMATPARSASRTPAKRTGAPSIRISPSSAGWTPERIFISVDLPAPFSPTSACTSPARRSKSTRSSAVTPAKCLVTLRARRKQIRVADARRAGHASRTPPKVPPLALAGESTIDKLGRSGARGSRKARSALAIRIRFAIASPRRTGDFPGGLKLGRSTDRHARERAAAQGRRLVAGGGDLSDLSALVPGFERRRGGGSGGDHPPAAVRGEPRGGRDLDLALLPVADARLRLRRDELPRRRSDVRHARRLRRADRAGARAGPAGDDRPRAQPHLATSTAGSARAGRAGTTPRPTGTSGRTRSRTGRRPTTGCRSSAGRPGSGTASGCSTTSTTSSRSSRT